MIGQVDAPRLRQCVILAGGLGTRLGALTADTPKPILDMGGRPFLEWLMREWCRWGVDEFLLLTGHLSAKVETAVEAIARRLPRPVEVSISVEPHRAGTGGALWHARDRLDPRFILSNGDSLLDGNLGLALAAAGHDGDEVLARMVLRAIPDAGRYGVATLDGERVTGFRERPPTPAGEAQGPVPGIINAGIYVLDRRILDRIEPTSSLERDVLPPLAEAGRVRGTPLDGWFIDIGVPEDLARARAELPARLRRPALFLDRDGVLNIDHGHVGGVERWEWVAGAKAAVSRATAAGWHVFVVTNQSGVARGFYDEAAVQGLLGWVAGEVRAAGGTIDDWRYCPHHPAATLDAYRRDCNWRKPGPGMILDLLEKWDVDPLRSMLVGDNESDVAAAQAAGVAGYRFPGGDLDEFVAPLLAAW